MIISDIEKAFAANAEYGDIGTEVLHALIIDKVIPYLDSVGLVVLPKDNPDLSPSALETLLAPGGGAQIPLCRFGQGDCERVYNPPKPQPVRLIKRLGTMLKHAWRTR